MVDRHAAPGRKPRSRSRPDLRRHCDSRQFHARGAAPRATAVDHFAAGSAPGGQSRLQADAADAAFGRAHLGGRDLPPFRASPTRPERRDHRAGDRTGHAWNRAAGDARRFRHPASARCPVAFRPSLSGGGAGSDLRSHAQSRREVPRGRIRSGADQAGKVDRGGRPARMARTARLGRRRARLLARFRRTAAGGLACALRLSQESHQRP